jgi:hypothetical protein
VAALTGKTPQATYKDLLQVSNTNSGIDATLRPVEDGEGTQSPLQLSSTAVNIESGLHVGGTAITASAAEINYVAGVTSAIQGQLDGKVAANSVITGATKTKIAYDAKGLVTAGADATTADVADSTDKRYVTDAQLTVLGNTSGTNSGDQPLFATISVSGQDDIVADSATDTLTFAAGSGISLTTNATSDTVTIASTVTQYTDADAKAAAVADAITDGVTDVAPSQNAVFDALAQKDSVLTFSTGLTRSTNTVTVNTTQNIAKLSNLTSNGFVKTSGGDGTLSVDTTGYLTGNETITLYGDVSGTGTTGITVEIAANVVEDGNLRQSAGLSVVGRSADTTGNVADITAASDSQVLRRSGTSIGFGAVDLTATNAVTGALRAGCFPALTGDVTTTAGSLATAIAANAVSNTKLRDSSALSVIGRSANSTGDPADIAASVDGQVLRRSGTTLGFGTVATAGITDAAVTYAKIQNVSATDRILGRSSAGAGVVQEITCTAAGRNLLDDADAAAQRTTLGLGTAATQNTSAFEVPLTFTNGVTRSSNAVSAVAVGCKAYESIGSQAMGNLVYTAVTFRAEAFDSNGFHSTASNTQKIVVPAGLGGKYLIVGTFWANYYTGANQTGSNVQTATNVSIDINGSQKAVIGLAAGGIGAIVAAESLAAGDEITMGAFHAYGSTLYTLYDAGGALNPSWYNLTAVWLGA